MEDLKFQIKYEMPTYHRFEELPLWQEAIRLAEEVYDLTETIGKRLSFSAKDQIERAALSVSNNIAEGYERGTTAELLTSPDSHESGPIEVPIAVFGTATGIDTGYP